MWRGGFIRLDSALNDAPAFLLRKAEARAPSKKKAPGTRPDARIL